jgi:hypothetical protein
MLGGQDPWPGPDPGERAASDVTEVEAHCARCEALRTFRKGFVDMARMEEQSASPSVRRALEGEEAWACVVCGAVRRDPVSQLGYAPGTANVAALRERRSELGLHGQGVSEDLAFRADTAGEGRLREPSTEDEALREDPALAAAPGEAVGEDDAALRAATQEELDEVERGGRDLSLEHGPKRGMPPPERIPRRDPTEP